MMTDKELVERCAAVRRLKKYPLAMGAGEVTVDYIEGMDLDGSQNLNRKNAFDDLHVIYTFKNGVWVLLFKAECTTQPGARYTLKPINPEGAAIADLGYHECWQPGLHRGNYPALIQTGGPIRVWRDRAKSYSRGQGATTMGWYGINQHHGADAPRTDIGGHSAGCLVTCKVREHQVALAIKKQDPRCVANPKFVHGAAIITAAWITGIGDHDARPRPSIKPDVPKTITHGGSGITGLLGTLSGTFAEHWYLFALLGAVIAGAAIAYYWREPYGRKEGDLPHAT